MIFRFILSPQRLRVVKWHTFTQKVLIKFYPTNKVLVLKSLFNFIKDKEFHNAIPDGERTIIFAILRPLRELSSRVSKRNLAAKWAGNAFLGLPFDALLRAVSACIGLCIGLCVCVVGRVAMCGFWKIDFHARNVFAHANTRLRGDLQYTRDSRCPRSRVTVALEATRVPFDRCKRFGRASIVPSPFRYPLSTGRHCRRFSSKGNLLNVTFLCSDGAGRSRTAPLSPPLTLSTITTRDGIEHLVASGRWIRILYKCLERRFQVHSNPRDFTRRLTKSKTIP